MRARSTLSLLVCAVLLAAAVAALAADDPWDRKVSLDLKDVRLGEAIRELFKNGGLNYTIDGSIGDAHIPSLSFKDVTLRMALDNLTRTAGAVYRVDGDIVLISKKPGNTDPWVKHVNLDVKDLPLSDVLDALFKDTGLNYMVDAQISKAAPRVTAVLKNVSLDFALRQVLKATGLCYNIEDNTVRITSSAYGLTGYQPQPNALPGMPPSMGAEAIVEKITLQYIDGGEVVGMLRMDGTVQVLSAGPSFVVIKGSEDAIEKAKKMIRMLDTPDAFPRPIRVKLIVTVRTSENGSPCTATTEGLGAEGSPMPMQIRVAVPSRQAEAGRPAPPVCELLLNGAVVPSIVAPIGKPGAETVSLVGQGVIELRRPIEFSKDFSVAASLPLQKGIVIASGSADAGGQKVSFEVTATAVLEEGRVRRPAGQPQQPGFGGGYGGSSYGGYEPRGGTGAMSPGAGFGPGGPGGPAPGMQPPPGQRPGVPPGGPAPVPGRSGPGARRPQGPQGPPPQGPPPNPPQGPPPEPPPGAPPPPAN